jgi:hypothetical protein
MEEAMIKARGRRLRAALVSGGLLAGVVAVTTASTPAQAVATKPPAGLSAFVNGTELHAHAVAVPDPKLADVDEAFSLSAVNSAGLTTKLVNEVNEAILPQAGKNAYARGGGVDVGVGSESPTNVNGKPLSLTIAESTNTLTAPFTSGLIQSETLDLTGSLDPVANARAAGGMAATLWNPNFLFPTLGNPLTFGYGHAAGAEALNQGALIPGPPIVFGDPVLSTEAPTADAPFRDVASTQTFTYLVNNGDGTCGIASEIHMTIAPVNINVLGTTIEAAGDWVMKGVATGKPTGNKLTYGPTAANGGTNIIRIFDNTTLADLIPPLQFQTLLGNTGLAEQLDPLDPLADVSVGADARAIKPVGPDGNSQVPDDLSQPTVSPTHVSGAADVVRLKLLSAAAPLDLGDIRVGHFEMDLKVPSGGVNCEIPVAKTSSIPVATTGNDVTFQVKVPSDPAAVKPFPCDLTAVKVTDVTSVEKADNPSKPPKMNIISGTGPKGEVGTVSADKQSINFANIGNWKPGDAPLVITIKANVPANSGTGIIKDVATATATPANCSGKNSVLGNVIGLISGDITGVGANFFGSNGVGLTGRITGSGPVSVSGTGTFGGPVALSQVLAVTGRNDGLFLLLGLGALVGTLGTIRLRRKASVGSSA